MTEFVPAPLRLNTGVSGLDAVLCGGLPRGSVHIVEGPPGAGKTLLANQIAFHVAGQGARSVYLTLLAESHARLLRHLRSLQFFRPELVGQGVDYVSGFQTLETEGLSGLLRLAREMLMQQPTALLILDGLLTALDADATGREYRKFLHELQTLAGVTECTVLLLAGEDRRSNAAAEHTMVDGILEITDDLTRLRAHRHLRVRKLRGSEPVRGLHTFTITSQGVAVRPRIEAELLRLPEDAPLRPSTERSTFGIHELDRMLRGGLPNRSTTMLLGPSGTGKTLLGLQFLASGAEKGQLGMYFGFYERPLTLLLKGERIQLGLEAARTRGLLEILWEPFGEGNLDSIAHRLLKGVRELRPQRLFLDGLQGFQQSADVPERLGSVFSTLAEQLELLEVTTVYSVEAEQLLGLSVRSPIPGLSAITHNVLLLRQEERGSELRRVFSILKMRDSGYEPHSRELLITDTGIQIGPAVGRPRRSGEAAPGHILVSSGAGMARATPSTRPRASILIVDDEFGLADLLAEILGDRGYDAAIAINGELGLSALRERRTDLVLLDVMMPVLSGPELRQRMRDDPALAPIPVILMTALLEAVPQQQRGQYAAVLEKPFTPAQLYEAVEKALHGEEGRGESVGEQSVPTRGNPAT